MPFLKTPSFCLDGRRSLVLGGSKGLGLASALALAEAGAHVTVASRTEGELKNLSPQIKEQGYSIDWHGLDVLDTPALLNFIQTQDAFQVFVHSAGVNYPQLAMDASEENYDRMFALNVKSGYLAVVEVARKLQAQKLPGSMIMISSQMAKVGAIKRSVYCATKHAVEGFVKSLAWEWGEQKIRINSICPTFVETDLTRPFLEDKAFKEGVLSNIALRKIGQVEDIMGSIVFLASDASSLITGSSIMLDGGWTAR